MPGVIASRMVLVSCAVCRANYPHSRCVRATSRRSLSPLHARNDGLQPTSAGLNILQAELKALEEIEKLEVGRDPVMRELMDRSAPFSATGAEQGFEEQHGEQRQCRSWSNPEVEIRRGGMTENTLPDNQR
jgi:hypothetical protein